MILTRMRISYHSSLFHSVCSCGAYNQSRSESLITSWQERHKEEGHEILDFYETAQVKVDSYDGETASINIG